MAMLCFGRKRRTSDKAIRMPSFLPLETTQNQLFDRSCIRLPEAVPTGFSGMPQRVASPVNKKVQKVRTDTEDDTDTEDRRPKKVPGSDF
jgi:hypothetical protein